MPSLAPSTSSSSSSSMSASPRTSMDSLPDRRSSLARTGRPAANVLHNLLSSDETTSFLSPALERAATRSSARRQSTMSVSPSRSFDSRSSDSYCKPDEGVASTARPSQQPGQSSPYSSSSSPSSSTSPSKSSTPMPQLDKDVRGSARSSIPNDRSDRGYSPLSAGFASLSRRGTLNEQSTASRSSSASQSKNSGTSRALAAGMFGGPA
ncbi:hypothetical protein K431DRAFT_300156 [Polychaeton citri CBS 116435]|uniref:Uncharacterized protein n=1 Tax=Polychaeton citri CBS 116435 TaxID=1314669 RepID=A0A9P4UTZ1_9PEZI|nr:hypothetical protein K431DRAFT_300156 [Polychaeton citri CBS 116435]